LCGIIVYTSIIHPEAGAYIAFFANTGLLALGTIAIRVKWKGDGVPST